MALHEDRFSPRPAAREAAQDLGMAPGGALGEGEEEESTHAQTTVVQVTGGKQCGL